MARTSRTRAFSDTLVGVDTADRGKVIMLDSRRPQATCDLDAEQASHRLEQQTLQFLGMTLDDFLRRAEEGRLPDTPAVSHLLLISGATPHKNPS